MLFNSLSFLIFFFVVWIGAKRLNTIPVLRNIVLLLASWFFYLLWSWEFLIILLYISMTTYIAGNVLGHTRQLLAYGHRVRRRKKKHLMLAAALLILGPLLGFKFAGVGYTLAYMFNDVHLSLLPGWVQKLAVPVGLSFFTLQALSYLIDVYQKKIRPESNFVTVFLAVSFFPTLLSGPITRPRELMPQLNESLPMDLEHFLTGAQQFIRGLFFKVVVAERLAAYVNPVYENPAAHSGKTLLLAAICYSLQIYADFAGYSDMAIGTARALGVNLGENFNRPYFATGIRDFWKRWHISLTGWFREYLYIPCGGNRVSPLEWVRNILLVFIVSGLWHGVTWNFLIWGTLHGLFYLAEYRLYRGSKSGPRGVWKVPAWLITFAAVTLAWIFFRMPDPAGAATVIQRIFTAWNAGNFRIGASSFTFALMPGAVALMLVDDLLRIKYLKEAGSWLSILWSVGLLLAIELLGMSGQQFVYLLF